MSNLTVGATVLDLLLPDARPVVGAPSLLALMGIDADPIQDPRHILVSNILAHRWRDEVVRNCQVVRDFALEDLPGQGRWLTA